MEEKTKLKKTKEWFENQKIIVVVSIILVAFFTISQIFKASNDIKNSIESLLPPEKGNATENDILIETEKNQTIEISGKVINKDSQPVKNAKVEIVDLLGNGDYTDDFGNFYIKTNLKEKTSTIEVSVFHESYKIANRKITLDEDGKVYISKIILEKIDKKQKNIVAKKGRSFESEKLEAKTIFNNTTVNGQIITSPTESIEINNNYVTKKDTINQ